MKNILISGLFNHLAGTEKSVLNYISRIHNCNFYILTYQHLSEFEQYLVNSSIQEIVIPKKRHNYFKYKSALRRLFEKYNFYAVWHCAGNITNIDCIKLGYTFKVPMRIFHAHNSIFDGSLRDKLLSRINRKKVLSLSTNLWACSKSAGEYFFKKRNYTIIYNAINFDYYRYSIKDRFDIRKELNIPVNYKVFGTIGRLTNQKNQKRLIELFNIYLKNVSDSAALIIIGEGELKNSLTDLINQFGISDKVFLLGNKQDVNRYLSSFDVFVMTSLYEGLPMVLVEAQANGLPCLLSKNISSEGNFILENKYIDIENTDDWLKYMKLLDRNQITFDQATMNLFDIDNQILSFNKLFDETEYE